MMRVGIAADRGGFTLKEQLAASLRGSGYEVVDFGAHQLNPEDDYPDFIIPSPGPLPREKWTAEWPSAAAASRIALRLRAASIFSLTSGPPSHTNP
jgi:ribose 5-phosphate isomerase B